LGKGIEKMNVERLKQRIKELESEFEKCNVEANTKKILNNGTFGKLGSKYSIFYHPTGMLQVTLTGQLAILMLIEQLEKFQIPVISANTDGIVLNCPRRLEHTADVIIKWWEDKTGFATEQTDYASIHITNVNNYIAIKPSGEVKCKGAYAPPDPGASGWPNPTGGICVTAIIQYLQHGIDLEETIRKCRDIREFLYVRTVKGGALYNHKTYLPKKATKKFQKAMCEQYGYSDYDDLYQTSLQQVTFLGKVVRWYYGKNCTSWLRYKESGNKVPRSDGAVPLMELTGDFPANVDYDWYVREANDLLTDMGME
jgi:hypothetical protein